MPLYDVIGSVEQQNEDDATIGWTFSQKLAHAAAKIQPLLIVGRGAFLQMLKWNVRAWAKNIQYLVDTQGAKASDPIGTRWYLFGGDAAPFWAAVKEGSTKKMIGNVDNQIGLTGVEITAMLTAAAPIIIAMTSLVKSISGKNDWEQGQLLPGMTSGGGGGSTLPPTSGGGIMDFIRRNPVPVALLAGGSIYLLTAKSNKVSGTVSNELLIGGGLLLLLMMNKNKQPAAAVTEPVLITEMPDNVFIPPSIQDQPVPQPEPVIEYANFDPVMDSNILAPFAEESFPPQTGYGFYTNGGSDYGMLKEYPLDQTQPSQLQ